MLKPPLQIMDARNSGTTLRLLTGLLSAQRFSSVITGDASLKQRPMGELIEALKRMGGKVRSSNRGGAPVFIFPREEELKGIKYESGVPSAQIKSALLLAGLYAKGETEIKEILPTRDHTERLMKYMGAEIEKRGNVVVLHGGGLRGQSIFVPGDLSSAAFFIVLATLLRGSKIHIHSVGLNHLRIGILEVIQKMGGNILIQYDRNGDEWGEPVGSIQVAFSELTGVEISAPLAVRLVDEIPLVALLATQAQGVTKILGAGMARFKETDRLRAITVELNRMGASIKDFKEGLVIEGPTPLHGQILNSYGDHRIAMTLALAGIIAKGETEIDSMDSVKYSFPGFVNSLKKLGVR